MRKLMLLCLLLPLAACSSAADRALRNSPDYRAGYSDGCASASLNGANPRESGPTRDEEAYRANQAYRRGWGAGFGTCRQMAMPQSPGGGPMGVPRSP